MNYFMFCWPPQSGQSVDGNDDLHEIDGVIEEINAEWGKAQKAGWPSWVEPICGQFEHCHPIINHIRHIVDILL